MIKPGATIGIIGGGQLGRMMAIAAKSAGYKIAVLEKVPDCPCGQVADHMIIGDYDNLIALEKLAEISDVITYEFENINYEALAQLEKTANVPQGSELLRITQNRIYEKQAIVDAGGTVAPYTSITEIDGIYDKIKTLGYPSVLKTSQGGYDGKGQVVIREEADINKAEKLLTHGTCILEKWVPFQKELSVIVVRNISGQVSVFPVVENIHSENILHKTIAPALVSQSVQELAIQEALKLAEAFQLVGTLAVEMFYIDENTIYINELAPRPHNSGHYSIDACLTSQFEQHVRAICNWPLGSTELVKPTVMVNILGQHQESILKQIETLPDWKLHLYGKEVAKNNRKMGHVTIIRNSVEEALEEIDRSEIWADRMEKIGG